MTRYNTQVCRAEVGTGKTGGTQVTIRRPIARVFARRTRATPDDSLAYYDAPGLFPIDVDAVHVSVTFTYDLPRAEELAREWRHVAPVIIGGPATGMRGEEFTPGRYLKPGYVITSRGCPNRCWFCSVWKREGAVVRELPITEGWNVLDDNILATSQEHFAAVCDMLKRQPKPAEFTGGLEAARLTDWHIERLREVKPKQLFFAYDTPDDLEPLMDAGRRLLAAGFTTQSHTLRCYVLIGCPRDTCEEAEKRLRHSIEAGFMPMAMLWRDERGRRDVAWVSFQRQWARPHIVGSKF